MSLSLTLPWSQRCPTSHRNPKSERQTTIHCMKAQKHFYCYAMQAPNMLKTVPDKLYTTSS